MRRDRRKHPNRGVRELDNDEPRKMPAHRSLSDDERSLICVPGGLIYMWLNPAVRHEVAWGDWHDQSSLQPQKVSDSSVVRDPWPSVMFNFRHQRTMG
jgi:hypothetical protein